MNPEHRTLGLVSVSFRAHTPKEILAAMQRAGLSIIEWGSDVHAPCRDHARLSELVSLQDEYGIRCCSYGTYFRLGETPIEELTDYALAAKTLGTNVLRLWCGSKSGAQMTAKERTSLLEECRQAEALAKELEVTLCMECHRNTLTQDPADAVWLMREIHSPHFRMYWQPFQWQEAEQNVANAQAIAPYAERIHVFHWKDDQKLPLADAVKDWRAYVAQFEPSVPLLLEFMPNGTIEELADEANALKLIRGESV